jgi:hypothetical protein
MSSFFFTFEILFSALLNVEYPYFSNQHVGLLLVTSDGSVAMVQIFSQKLCCESFLKSSPSGSILQCLLKFRLSAALYGIICVSFFI